MKYNINYAFEFRSLSLCSQVAILGEPAWLVIVDLNNLRRQDVVGFTIINLLITEVIVTNDGLAAGVSRGFSRVCLSVVCLSVCPHSNRKMVWAINTKHGTRILYSSRSACIDPEVKRSKVKVTRLRKPSRRTVAGDCSRHPVTLCRATCGGCRRWSACRYDCLCFLISVGDKSASICTVARIIIICILYYVKRRHIKMKKKCKQAITHSSANIQNHLNYLNLLYLLLMISVEKKRRFSPQFIFPPNVDLFPEVRILLRETDWRIVDEENAIPYVSDLKPLISMPIHYARTVKSLGLTTDNTLSFDDHVN